MKKKSPRRLPPAGRSPSHSSPNSGEGRTSPNHGSVAYPFFRINAYPAVGENRHWRKRRGKDRKSVHQLGSCGVCRFPISGDFWGPCREDKTPLSRGPFMQDVFGNGLRMLSLWAWHFFPYRRLVPRMRERD